MSRGEVTITLGRSGQKVVKRSLTSHGTSVGQHALSGGKRSLAETFGTNSGDPLLSLHKRVRGDGDAGGSRYGGLSVAQVGQNDLRLKLIRRRRHRELLLQIEHGKKELHKTVAGSVPSAEPSQKTVVTNIRPSSGAHVLHRMEALRHSNASQTSGYVRPRSPNRFGKDSREVSSSRNIAVAQHVPLPRPTEASRTVRMLGSDLLNPSWLRGLAPVTMRSTPDTEKMSGFSSANGSRPQSSYPDEQPVTVASLLNSLGLGKYAIHFQAEEVDMTVLKQMGDRDLKELGIPMGPRKKILLAMLSRTKRPVIHAV